VVEGDVIIGGNIENTKSGVALPPHPVGRVPPVLVRAVLHLVPAVVLRPVLVLVVLRPVLARIGVALHPVLLAVPRHLRVAALLVLVRAVPRQALPVAVVLVGVKFAMAVGMMVAAAGVEAVVVAGNIQSYQDNRQYIIFYSKYDIIPTGIAFSATFQCFLCLLSIIYFRG
jgi:hypothetical protein